MTAHDVARQGGNCPFGQQIPVASIGAGGTGPILGITDAQLNEINAERMTNQWWPPTPGR